MPSSENANDSLPDSLKDGELHSAGLHHITAIAGDPQRNLDFYTGVLGLRLVKLTVNFDDPGTYHFYYGDGVGNPGTILTFFPFLGSPKGRPGTGQASAIAFAIPKVSADYWTQRLTARGIMVSDRTARFDEQVIAFNDPDGLPLELILRDVPAASDPAAQWVSNSVPAAHALRGFDQVTLSVIGYERTAHLLTDVMHFQPIGSENDRYRYTTGRGESGTIVDVLCQPEARRGTVAVGSVHHIAWRTPDDDQQAVWHTLLAEQQLNVTPVQDRQYFNSIYFREPGGVLFEIATDPPGFATDETVATLGTSLKLPQWLEAQRPLIERMLPPLRLPGVIR